MRHARRLPAVVVLLLALVCPAEAQRYLQATAHITTNTTTTVLTSGQATRQIAIMAGSICVDNGGTATGVSILDSASTNLFGANVVWLIGANTCKEFPYRGFPWGSPAAKGKDLQVVTSAAGPVEVILEVQYQ